MEINYQVTFSSLSMTSEERKINRWIKGNYKYMFITPLSPSLIKLIYKSNLDKEYVKCINQAIEEFDITPDDLLLIYRDFQLPQHLLDNIFFHYYLRCHKVVDIRNHPLYKELFSKYHLTEKMKTLKL